jgi:hypothetical protein
LDDRPAREIEDLRERAERAEREHDQALRSFDRELVPVRRLSKRSRSNS